MGVAPLPGHFEGSAYDRVETSTKVLNLQSGDVYAYQRTTVTVRGARLFK